MKKIILPLIAGLILSGNAFAENESSCKHNTLHFATSVEKIKYVKNLLDLKAFNLRELNKQCQTAPHIAVELGNLEILELFYDYLGNLDIENGKGENLLESSFIYKKPSILLYLISKGEDPYKKSSNGLSAHDYQDKYGNNLTAKILEEYDIKKAEKKVEEEQVKKDEILKNLHEQIDNKEKELTLLMAKAKTDESVKEIEKLTLEISTLKSYIRQLEEIINSQALELKKYKNLKNEQKESLKEASIKSDNHNETLTTHVPEGFEVHSLPEPTKMEDVKIDDKNLKEKIETLELSDLSSDGEVLNNSMKLFELLSKPIIKVEKK